MLSERGQLNGLIGVLLDYLSQVREVCKKKALLGKPFLSKTDEFSENHVADFL